MFVVAAHACHVRDFPGDIANYARDVRDSWREAGGRVRTVPDRAHDLATTCHVLFAHGHGVPADPGEPREHVNDGRDVSL